MVRVNATVSASGPLKRTFRSTNMPTLMRKKGMNNAFPTNSILFIRGEVRGTSVLSANPAINAPMMGSIPATSAKKLAKNTMPNTRMYWETFSPSSLLKNHLTLIGNSQNTITEKMMMETSNLIQNLISKLPSTDPVITAKINKTAVSVMIVPPTTTVTASFLIRPSLLAMG